MPDFEVTLRYLLAWTAVKIVTAASAEDAQEKIERLFPLVDDYESFKKFVAEDSTPQVDDESLDVAEVNEL